MTVWKRARPRCRRRRLSTAVGLILGTAAFAQSPSGSTSSPTSAQNQTNSPTNSTNASSTQRAPSADSSTRSEPSNSAANQSGPSSPGSPSQAQTTPSAQSATPSHVQTNKPPPANSQAEQAPSSGTGNTNATAQQPNQPNQQSTAQSSSTNVNASVHINDQQRTRVTQSIDHLNVQPLTNVNFSLSVGTAVPRDVRLQTLPADVVEVVPQYRGYSFFVVRDEIVIVEPSTYKIVTVLPRSGGTTAAAPASSSRKVTFTDRDRDVVRKHTGCQPGDAPRAAPALRGSKSAGANVCRTLSRLKSSRRRSIAKPLRSGIIGTSTGRIAPTSWRRPSVASLKRSTKINR